MCKKPGLGPKKNYKDSLFSPLEQFFYKSFRVMGQKAFFYDIYQHIKPVSKDLRQFKDRHTGERCFIIGGGPSLLKLDLEPLKNEITFGVNSIFLIFDLLHFQPNYYVVEDWLVYEDRFDDIKEKVTESNCFFPIQFSTKDFDRANHHYFRAIY